MNLRPWPMYFARRSVGVGWCGVVVALGDDFDLGGSRTRVRSSYIGLRAS